MKLSSASTKQLKYYYHSFFLFSDILEAIERYYAQLFWAFQAAS